jgi:hypothetical protein
MNEKLRVFRSPKPGVRAAREAEDYLLVAEIVLGRALEGRDRLAGFGTVERAKSSPAQAGQAAGVFPLMSGALLKLTSRAIDFAQEAYRGAVAQMQRLSFREDADTEADAREAIEEKVLAEEAERKAAEDKLAALAAARREEARHSAEEKAIDEGAREVAEAQARDAAQEAAKRQTAEDARLKAEEAARKASEGKPKSDAEAKKHAERAEAELAQQRARTKELEQQLAARADEQKLLAQERVRTKELEQQLAARADEQKLLAQERARTKELEQQLAARADEQKLLAQERARTQKLELQLAVRGDATPDRGRSATASPLDRPAWMPTHSPANLEAARLMAQARLLLDQGNIIAARSVLERAAESGSALALFLLAETYDGATLSTWGIFGRLGNVNKARELYAKAVACGVHEAKYRLSALR